MPAAQTSMIEELFWLGLGYDLWAAGTRRPTITQLCRRHPWIAVPVLAITAAHLLRKLENFDA